jgi:hypothetical protein
MFLNARLNSEEYFSSRILNSFKSFVGFFECRRGTAVQLPRANEPSIILVCVRWYGRYQLSYRDLEEMMRERGLSVDHVTIFRWVPQR